MPTKYAALPEREAQKAAVEHLENMIHPTGEHTYRPSGADYHKAKRQLEAEKKRLEEISPPEMQDDRMRKAVVERLKLLETALVQGSPQIGVPGMPTKQQMWESTDVNVDRQLAHEGFWKDHNLDKNGRPYRVDKRAGQQGAIFEWKDLRRVLMGEQEQLKPHIASVEYVRPDKASSLSDTGSKSFRAPNLTWDEYDRICEGRSELSEIQFQVRQSEEAGTARIPAPEDIYKTDSYRCNAPTANGTLCGNRPMSNSNRCRHHLEE